MSVYIALIIATSRHGNSNNTNSSYDCNGTNSDCNTTAISNSSSSSNINSSSSSNINSSSSSSSISSSNASSKVLALPVKVVISSPNISNTSDNFYPDDDATAYPTWAPTASPTASPTLSDLFSGWKGKSASSSSDCLHLTTITKCLVSNPLIKDITTGCEKWKTYKLCRGVPLDAAAKVYDRKTTMPIDPMTMVRGKPEPIPIGVWSAPSIDGVPMCSSSVQVDMTGGGLLLDVRSWMYYGMEAATQSAKALMETAALATGVATVGVHNPCDMPQMELCPPLHPMVLSTITVACPAFFKCVSAWKLEEPSSFLRVGNSHSTMHYDLAKCQIDPVQILLSMIPFPIIVYLWRKHQRRRSRIRSETMAPEWAEIYKKNVLSVDNMHEFDRHGHSKSAMQHGKLPPIKAQFSTKYKVEKIHPGLLKC